MRPYNEGCTPFVVHGGGALTRELVAQCPSLAGKYRAPAWCSNGHAQTILGQGGPHHTPSLLH